MSTKDNVLPPMGERGLTIYHNPRCRKSREGLQILENSKQDFEVIKYLENIPSEKELKEIIKLLGISPIQLVRKNEKIWKENYKDNELTDDKLIQVMIENPKLIERPIIINNNKAIVGRPPSSILEIL